MNDIPLILKRVRFLFIRLFSCRYMLKPQIYSGELPQSSSLYKNALLMAYPAMIETILVALIGVIDTIMVGVLGHESIAAVGLVTQPRAILLAIINALNIGVQAVTARRIGEKNVAQAEDVLRQSILISIIFSLIVSYLGFIFARPFLIFAGAGNDTIDLAVQYFRITCIGFVFTSVSLTINAAQRGAGNTKISMRTNLIANVINVILNYLLISGNFGFPAWGVRGAAIATVIGYVVACAMSFFSIRPSSSTLHLIIKSKQWFQKDILQSLYKIGSSSFVEQICIRLGFFIFAKIAAELGTTEFAVHIICMNMLSISFSFAEGLSIASVALVGRSLGEKKPHLAIIYGKILQKISFLVSFLLSFIFIVNRYFIISLFNKNEYIINLGAFMMFFVVVVLFAQTSQVVFFGSLRGAGDTKFIAFASFISVTSVRPGLAYLFAYIFGWGLVGVWIALIVDQYIRLLFSGIRFSHAKWINIKI